MNIVRWLSNYPKTQTLTYMFCSIFVACYCQQDINTFASWFVENVRQQLASGTLLVQAYSWSENDTSVIANYLQGNVVALFHVFRATDIPVGAMLNTIYEHDADSAVTLALERRLSVETIGKVKLADSFVQQLCVRGTVSHVEYLLRLLGAAKSLGMYWWCTGVEEIAKHVHPQYFGQVGAVRPILSCLRHLFEQQLSQDAKQFIASSILQLF